MAEFMATVQGKSTKIHEKPTTLRELRLSGWHSQRVKREIYDNFMRMLGQDEEFFPGIIGYEDTVIPEINLGLIAQHDILFLGEKGQGKSRLMRLLTRFLDEAIPYWICPAVPFGGSVPADHRDGQTLVGGKFPTPRRRSPGGRANSAMRAAGPGHEVRRHHRRDRPSKLAAGTSMSAEEALHFGLIPRMHRGIFAVNELPELDEMVQVGLFNILEERDVQIRGYPIRSTSTC